MPQVITEKIGKEFIKAGGRQLGRRGRQAQREIIEKYRLSETEGRELREKYGPQFRVFGAKRKDSTPSPVDTSNMTAGQLADYIKSRGEQVTSETVAKYAPEAVAKARAVPAFTGVVRETGAGQPELIKTFEAGKLVSVTEAPKALPPKVEAVKVETAKVGEERLKEAERAITAYQPFTKEEIKKAEQIRFRYEPFAYIKEKVISGLEVAKQKVASAYEKVYYAYKPEEKVAQEKIKEVYGNYESGVKKYNEQSKNFQAKVSTFEKKYIGRELSQEEYDVAAKEQEKLKGEARELEEHEKFWSDFQGRIKTFEEKENIKAKAISPVRKVLTSFSIGVVTAPLAAAGLVLTAVTKPSEIVKGIYYETPKAIYERPLEAIPEMLGGAVVFTGVAGAIKAAISRASAIRAATRVNPKVGVSFETAKAVKVGENLWKVESRGEAKLIHPKTGKLIDKVKLSSVSEVVSATTKEGAIKAGVKSYVGALEKYGLRKYVSQEKVTMKLALGKGVGRFTIEPSAVEGIYKGYGPTEIKIGVARAKLTGREFVAKAKLEPVYRKGALTQFITKKVEPAYFETKILGKGVKLYGTEEIYGTKAVTDVYAKLYKVKGYEQWRIKPLSVQMRRIKSYYRKPAVEPKAFREFGVSYTKAFTPKKIAYDFNKLIVEKPLIRAKIPKDVVVPERPIVSVPESMQKLIRPEIKMPSETAIQSISKTLAIEQSKAVTRAILGEARRVRITTIPKTRVTPILAPVFGIKGKEQQRYIARVSQATKFETISLARQIDIMKYGEIQIQPQRQVQRQFQGLIQPQLQAPKLVTPLIPIPTFPKPIIPTIRPPKIRPIKPIIPIIYRPKEKAVERKQRKSQQRRYIKWQRKYQASVAAVSLGITISPKKAKKLKKRFIGTEIRPIILSNNYSNYSKRLNRAFTI